MSKPLENKVALVTGASRGIGRTIAQKLAADGATVAVHYGRSRDSADKVVAEIEADGGTAFAVGAELTQPAAITELFATLDSELQTRTGANKIDILVNNAGIAPFVGFADTTPEQLDEIYTINVKAPYLIAQEALKRFNNGGRIINFSSVVARLPMPDAAAYSALKAPIDNLTMTLSAVGGPRNIAANAIAPGVIQTEMTDAMLATEDGQAFALSKQTLKRIGQSDDVADVVAFLAGPGGRWITGQVIEVSGGSVVTY